MTYHLATGENHQANALVRDFHYSGRPPANVQLCVTWHESGGLFGDQGEAVAACMFSIPPTRWAEEVFELSRLVRKPGVEMPLTGLISDAMRLVRRRTDLVVSFADATHRHHGGIYQAASWNFAGKRESRMDGVLVGERFVPGRSCNSIWGTRSPDRLAALGIEAEPHYDLGKYCYWRALSPSGELKAAKLGLGRLPYPKPGVTP